MVLVMLMLLLMLMLMLRLLLMLMLMVILSLNTISIVNSNGIGKCGGSLMFSPFSGARSKGTGFDCTKCYATFSGWSGREKGWKEYLRLCLRLCG